VTLSLVRGSVVTLSLVRGAVVTLSLVRGAVVTLSPSCGSGEMCEHTVPYVGYLFIKHTVLISL